MHLDLASLAVAGKMDSQALTHLELAQREALVLKKGGSEKILFKQAIVLGQRKNPPYYVKTFVTINSILSLIDHTKIAIKKHNTRTVYKAFEVMMKSASFKNERAVDPLWIAWDGVAKKQIPNRSNVQKHPIKYSIKHKISSWRGKHTF